MALQQKEQMKKKKITFGREINFKIETEIEGQSQSSPTLTGILRCSSSRIWKP